MQRRKTPIIPASAVVYVSMSVKRVTESYTKGSSADARRPAPSAGARAPAPPPAAAPKAALKRPAKVDEAVAAAIVADLAALHRAQKEQEAQREAPSASKPVISEAGNLETVTPKPVSTSLQGSAPAIAEYREIIANTIAGLEHNTAEARRAVYDYARRVVHQRLAEAQPALSAEAIEREDAALNRIIDDIEADAIAKQTPASTPTEHSRVFPAKAATQPPKPVAAPTRRDLAQAKHAQAKHIHGGVLRLFAIVGLISAGLIAYWLIAGRPGMNSAVALLPPLPKPATVEPPSDGVPLPSTANATAVQTTPAEETAPPATPAPTNTEPANTASAETTPAFAGNPLMPFKADCGGAPCPGPYGDPQPPSNTDSAAWVASYGTIKSPLSPSRSAPENSKDGKDAAKLLDAGRAAAAPSASGSYERGVDKARTGDSEGAIRDFTEAIRLDPNFADAFIQRGNARFKNGNADLALTDFSDAIGIDNRNAGAFKARGMARLYNADEDGALEDLTRAIQIAESEPARLTPIDLFFARRSRASIYSRKQASDRELFDLSAMLDAYWKNPDLADALKTNYGAQGSTSLMATIYRQRAALYVQRANTDGAVADLSLALQLDPARAIQFVLDRARLLEAAGRREQAAADFQRALQINPRVEEAKQAIARLGAKP